MKITGYRKTKGGRALLGMLLLCAFSSAKCNGRAISRCHSQ